MRVKSTILFLFFAVAICIATIANQSYAAGGGKGHKTKEVTIPAEDRFSPYVLQIKPGDTVKWINQDTDDHSIVAIGTFTTSGPKTLNYLLPGTTSNGGAPGTYSIKFKKPGVFTYYCRFHSELDSANQPIAPGPDGGIQSLGGNYGTPMTGIIAVVPPASK